MVKPVYRYTTYYTMDTDDHLTMFFATKIFEWDELFVFRVLTSSTFASCVAIPEKET